MGKKENYFSTKFDDCLVGTAFFFVVVYMKGSHEHHKHIQNMMMKLLDKNQPSNISFRTFLAKQKISLSRVWSIFPQFQEVNFFFVIFFRQTNSAQT